MRDYLGASRQNEILRTTRAAYNAANAGRVIAAPERDVFSVPSERFAGAFYQVFLEEERWVCTCEDFQSRREPCKHILEILYRFFPDEAPPLPDIAVAGNGWYADARRFPRVPHAYLDGLAESTRRDAALETADVRTEQLVVDLAKVMNAGYCAPCGPGRRTLPPGDRVVVAVARTQHRKSMRRVQPLLKRLAVEGKIMFPPSKGSLVAYNNDPETTRALQEAFAISIRPFRLLERDVIIDSSGISSFFVSCWRLSERGNSDFQAGTKWFKVHLAIGRESKAILGFTLTEHKGEGTSDHANFKPLLELVSNGGFELRYVIADNAYLSATNRDICAGYGATLVGPIKGRNYGKSGEPLKAIKHILALRASDPNLYDELCRSRQAIEGVFSLEKRIDNRLSGIGTLTERSEWRSGDRDSLFVSRRNEVLSRALRYNLNCTVTQEQLRNRHILYSRGSVFSHVRETIANGA